MKQFFIVCSVILLLFLSSLARAETHALLIGLGDYQDKAFDKLLALTSGANGLAKVLIKNGVPAANVELLTHETKTKPTRKAIIDALNRLGERVKKDDVVWVFYYGHGNQRRGVSYLSCYDSKPTPLDAPDSTGLSVREFLAPLAKLPASLLIMGFESCRSEVEGGNADASIPQGVRQVDFNLAMPEGKPGPRRVAAFLSSADSRYSFILTDRSLGVFGLSLLRGMEGGAADAMGTIRVKNLADYLGKAVPGVAYREYGVPQTPEFLAFGEGVKDVVLSQGHEPQRGGETAVPLKIGDTSEEKWAAEFQQGYELRDAKKPEEALKHFKAAADIKPEDSRAQSLVGVQYYEMEKLDDAETYFLKSIKGKDAGPAPFLYLGLIREKRQKYDEAETYFRKSYQLGKNWHYASYYYGLFLLNVRQDQKQGEKLLREALKLEPQDPYIKTSLARVLLQRNSKNTDEIKGLIDAALKLSPNYSEAYYALGLLEFYLKKDDKTAEKSFLRCLELEPNHFGAMLEMSRIYYQVREDYKASEKWTRKLIALQPQVGYYQMLLAHDLYMQNDLDEARKAAKKSIEMGAYNKDAEIYTLLNVKPETKPKDEKKP